MPLDGKEKADTDYILSSADLQRERESASESASESERKSAKDTLRKQYALNQIMGNSKAVHEPQG